MTAIKDRYLTVLLFLFGIYVAAFGALIKVAYQINLDKRITEISYVDGILGLILVGIATIIGFNIIIVFLSCLLELKNILDARKDNKDALILFLKVRELAQHLVGKRKTLDFRKPLIKLNRMDTENLRDKIKRITYTQWKNLGLSKGTLHYMKQNANADKPFTVNKHILKVLGSIN